jgi:small subunit ribosomal protein S6
MIGPLDHGEEVKIVRQYEFMYIIRPDLDEEATNAVVEKYNQLITNNGGEVVNSSRWGKRRLAYEVKDFKEGIYMLVHFNSEPATERELERVLKISDDVIRHLITRKDQA